MYSAQRRRLKQFSHRSYVKTMFADSGHFGPRSGSLNTILAVDYLRTIDDMFVILADWFQRRRRCIRHADILKRAYLCQVSDTGSPEPLVFICYKINLYYLTRFKYLTYGLQYTHMRYICFWHFFILVISPTENKMSIILFELFPLRSIILLTFFYLNFNKIILRRGNNSNKKMLIKLYSVGEITQIKKCQ
jgi:hypothetical protein